MTRIFLRSTKNLKRFLMLMLFTMLVFCFGTVFCSCNSCNENKQSSNTLKVVVNQHMLSYLAPLIKAFEKQSGKEKYILIRADEITEFEKFSDADLFIINGREKLADVKASIGFQGQAIRLVNDMLEIVVNRKSKLTLDRPAHLLQPALKKIAIAKAGTLRQSGKQFLEDWRLLSRLKHKLTDTKSAKQAYDFVTKGLVDAAFIYRSDRVGGKKVLKIILGQSYKDRNRITHYVAIGKNTKNPDGARRLKDFLLGDSVTKFLHAKGFLPVRAIKSSKSNVTNAPLALPKAMKKKTKKP